MIRPALKILLFIIVNILLVQVHIRLFQSPVVWLGIGSGLLHLVLLAMFPYRKLL